MSQNLMNIGGYILKSNSSQNEIKELGFPDHARLRPGMYIGSLHNPSVAFREIIDNSVDEILRGVSDTTWIYNHKDGKYIVADSGSGIPLKEATKLVNGEEVPRGITMTELAVGTVNAGSKFNKSEVQTGTNGVGSSVVNCLADPFIVYSKLSLHDLTLSPTHVQEMVSSYGLTKGTEYYRLEYSKGLKQSETIVDLSSESNIPDALKEVCPSTIVYFEPDMTLWKSAICDTPLTTKYLQYIQNKKGKEVKFYINDVLDTSLPETYEYDFDTRIENKVNPDSKNPWMQWYVSFGISEDLEDYRYEASVNTLKVPTGYHVRILTTAYSEAFRRTFGDCKGKECLGINMMFIVNCPEPVFTSQTKEKLGDIPGFNMYETYEELVNEFYKIINHKDNYDKFLANHSRIVEYLKSREQWSKINIIESSVMLAKDQKAGSSAFLPYKLKDATNPDRELCELYVVEGDSAGAQLLAARTGMDTVAILPLRGKPMNTSHLDIVDVLENNEMYDLINAVGCGVNDLHDTSVKRYGKLIIACFKGNEKVDLLTGESKTFEELAEICKANPDAEFPVYSIDTLKNQFVPGIARNARITGYRKEMIRITLDSGEVHECTPEHKWMLKDGTYKEAKDLKINESLRAIYRKLDRHGYEIYFEKDSWWYTHHTCGGEYTKEYDDFCKKHPDEVIQFHHIDHNPINNDPKNIQMLTQKEHASNHITEYNRSEDRINYIKQLREEGAYKHLYFGANGYNESQEHRDLLASMNADEDMKFKQFRGRFTKKILRRMKDEGDFDTHNFTKHLTESEYVDFNYYYESEEELYEWCRVKYSHDTEFDCFTFYNHKVKSIELVHYDEPIPVYCMEVDNYHNFMLSSSAVVHNCDSDIDGSSIMTLILGAIIYHMTFLLEEGMVYIAEAPLFYQDPKLNPNLADTKGYVWAGEEDKLDMNKELTRFKGLGEMNDDQLRDTLLDPKVRHLRRVTPEGIETAKALLTSSGARKILMRDSGFITDSPMKSILKVS